MEYCSANSCGFGENFDSGNNSGNGKDFGGNGKGPRKMMDICGICGCAPVLATKLPNCSHHFCYMCIKTLIAQQDPSFNQNMYHSCPTCRAMFTRNILYTPQQVNVRRALPLDYEQNVQNGQVPMDMDEDVKPDLAALQAAWANGWRMASTVNATFMWLYKARGDGWWRFDPRDERLVEEGFQAGQEMMFITILGNQYEIDFDLNLQTPVLNRSIPREIWRVTAEEFDGLVIRGVAGVTDPIYWDVK
ncbi:hypothetical protein L5515_018905 [Caenorhabditis briggsae]|uniref:RING-type domain-containing protein n=2 Tax=Caenorhabditis briggsae TaxID=6238 RepID=A0AAE9FHL7_CAEBR|nr:hypothetical protein L5515_018905 [Caenorhabditis briggsae]